MSTLNDRALRRLLGARAYLRGYDYVRRRAVENIVIDEAGARGNVRGTDADPYKVTLQLTPGGFTSGCTCPAYASSNGGHCKHVAALLIALRDQVRGAQPRPVAQPAPVNGVHYTVHGGTVHVAGVEGEGRRSKRARARAMKAAQQAAMAARGFVSATGGVDAWLPEPMPPSPKTIEYRLQVKQIGYGSNSSGG
ncbi:MAG TPA: SWIM zinc finger family protein, partial [Polyangiaceae bacterium]|nr:SWIM zinc finger family protein [Polyangiaceae bacterium]